MNITKFGYAIKFDDGTYYAGLDAEPKKSALEAKIYCKLEQCKTVLSQCLSLSDYERNHSKIVSIDIIENDI